MVLGATKPTLTGDPIIDEARRRFDRCSEWEAITRQRFLEDIRFANGDPDNGYQWPNEIRNVRDTTARPCLTMNLVNRHNKMISNELRKNKSSVKFIGMGNGATQESANVYRDLMRHVEYQSQAQSAYSIAREFQIGGGIGWWRVTTDYCDEFTVDEQEIFIRPVLDPLSVFMDPDIQQKNGSDAKFAFVFDDMSEEEFEEAYPEYAELVGNQPLGMGTVSGDWISRGQVRVCEYFRKVPKKGQNVSFVHEGTRFTVPHANLTKIVRDRDSLGKIMDDPMTRVRDVISWEIEWKLIAGEKVIDETTWLGKYIPLIRCIGEETVIEGVLDRKGHTRWSKDAQRMFNYNASAQIEFVALQGKTPWIAPVKAIEEHEAVWNTANILNPSVLPYNHIDPEGDPMAPIPPPSRTEPPSASPAYQAGMDTASNQMMMTSGQYQNQLGMAGNERTGAAIQKRQDQSDTANFHFQDNYEDALIYTGMIFIDLVPKVYDTKRVKRIQAEDGVDYDLEIDPTMRGAYLQEANHNNEVVKRCLNPQIGKYGIASSVGPAYGSKREETAEALTTIITQAPGLTGIIGDLLMSSLDFDKAQEAAIRLRRMVPQVALGNGPTQNEQALQEQLQAIQAALVKTLDEKAKLQIKYAGKEELRDIEGYDAETKRIAAMAKMLPTDAEGMRRLVQQLVEDSLSTSITNVLHTNMPKAGETSEPAPELPPVLGASKAADGEWYLTDPTRHGKYLHVAPLAQEHSRPGVVSNV